MAADASDTARYQRAKALFLDALDQPPPAREAFLDDACNGDDALRRELDALLAAHAAAEATERLDAPLLLRLDARADEGEPDDPVVGWTVGPWRLEERIGVGGMGAVYRAARADGAYEREVAVKLLKPGGDVADLARRLRAERRLLARLDHPHIARLYDGGVTDDGLPYLALELVDGQPLTDHADAAHLSVEDRLRLFLQACEAVAYAHQRLIVHRDLKPSNILVDEDEAGPTVKLLDFGIARLLDDEDEDHHTRTGLRALTPAYAAPEQLLGQPVTTATDVYALGIVLYELLTGQRPYEVAGRTASEIERLVCETAPAKPSTAVLHPAAPVPEPPERLTRRLRGDLDTIILKALAKEPERRYPSADALAADLQRHLGGLPVEAQPATPGYRLRKFVQRHRTGVAAAAAVGLLVATLVAFYTVRLAAERDVAERRFAVAREAARALLFDVHDAVAELPGSTPTREVIVRRSMAYLDALAAEADDDQALRLDLAQAYLRIGNVLGNPNDQNLGRLDEARQSYRRGLGLLPERPADSLALRVTHVRGVLHEKLADVAAFSGDPEEGVARMDTALTFYRRNADAEPDNPDRLVTLAIGHLKRGDYAGNRHYPNANRPDEALEEYRTSLALLDRAATSTADRATRLMGLLHERLGTIYITQGDLDQAREAYQRSLRVREALFAAEPANTEVQRDVGVAHEKVGEVYEAEGRLDSARVAFGTAVAVYEAIAEADPEDVRARQTLAIGLLHLGDVYDGSNAARHYRRSIALLRALAVADTSNTQLQALVAEAEGKLGDR